MVRVSAFPSVSTSQHKEVITVHAVGWIKDGKPESFTVDSKHVFPMFPMLQKETLSLSYKAIHCINIFENMVWNKSHLCEHLCSQDLQKHKFLEFLENCLPTAPLKSGPLVSPHCLHFLITSNYCRLALFSTSPLKPLLVMWPVMSLTLVFLTNTGMAPNSVSQPTSLTWILLSVCV